MTLKGIAGASMVALVPYAVSGQNGSDGAHVDVFAGAAWNLPLPLTFSGTPETLRFHANFSTRPFSDSPYYSVRLGHTNDGRGVEAELIHHKLYLENPAPPIERLEITHGYNLPVINAVGPANGWQFRVGIGLVVAHPEGRIAGQNIGGGYRIAGTAIHLALGRRYPLSDGDVVLTATPEVKLTGSIARIRVPSGVLSVPNVAFHALAGLGLQQRTW